MKKYFTQTALVGLIALSINNVAYAGDGGVWGGIDVSNDLHYSFIGAVSGISDQKDIDKDKGFLVRIEGGVGEYKYDTIFYQGGDPTLPYDVKIDGKVKTGSFLVGYRHFYDEEYKDVNITAYLGGEIQNQTHTPFDADNKVVGTKEGVKVLIEASARSSADYKLDIAGSYSSVFKTYWSRASVQYTGENFSIGPEISVMGNQAYDQRRIGVASSYQISEKVRLNVSAGGAENSRQGKSGAYTTTSVTRSF